MRVLMLIGPPAIGKTTFAKSLAAKHDSVFIDLKDFQPKYMSWEDIQKSYDIAEKELRKLKYKIGYGEYRDEIYTDIRW